MLCTESPRSLLSHKHLQGNDEDMNPPAMLHVSVTVFLLIARKKREASERVQIHIVTRLYHLLWCTVKGTVKNCLPSRQIGQNLRYYRLPSQCTVNWWVQIYFEWSLTRNRCDRSSFSSIYNNYLPILKQSPPFQLVNDKWHIHLIHDWLFNLSCDHYVIDISEWLVKV